MIIVLIIFLSLGQANKGKEFNLVISNPKIINVEDGSILLDHDILINGNIIAGIVPHRKKYDESITVIDATNKYAIPGLWDMHAHALGPYLFEVSNPLMVANGITGFRDMWGVKLLSERVKGRMQSGVAEFQRFIIPGNLIDGAEPVWQSLVAPTPDRGIELVDSLYKAGAGFIKVYSRLKPEVFFAIARRCKELSISFAGHVPQKVRLIDASNAGMYSMEHMYGFTEAFSDKEDSIFLLNAKIDFETGDSILNSKYSAERMRLISRSNIIEEKVKPICEALKKNNTWIVPTLVILKNLSQLEILDTVQNENLEYLPDSRINSWKLRAKNRTPQLAANSRIIYEKSFVNVGLLNKHGVGILAGTDFTNPYCIPGFSLHEELVLLNNAGLSTLQALQSATLNPAKYLNKTDSLGTIAPNKYADILLLSENPLSDITHTRKIEGLVLNGRYYSKNDLEGLKQKAKEASEKINKESRN